ncbi:homocysteine-responsive endoplasmic reticulum-resident ubiquitin-like domain member 1 protein [Paramacrobiotus metropolitanus]|uniref:homocysteine-responsive endoplasmic reticulum-resident ubiquitin-like domain member 1 protein n=1 Tax=Paramacrobiotus metropolitanus TaxID=2943436 RepID=UPI0024463B1A|nr:homocysteine-responsive endoplasmic reticulum-resident ubiquitin-like domain member 1 protein [Paramacrobiotus metropolitanus]
MEHVPVVIKVPFGEGKEDFSTSVLPSWTILQLKKHLEDTLPRKPRAEAQKLIFGGRILTDDHLLKDCIKSVPKGFPPVLHLVHSRSQEETPTQHAAPDVTESDGLRQRHVQQPAQEAPANTSSHVPPAWTPYQYGFGYNDQMVQEYQNYIQSYMHHMSQAMPGMMPMPFNTFGFPYQFPGPAAAQVTPAPAPHPPNRAPAVAVVRIHRAQVAHVPAVQEIGAEEVNAPGHRDVLDWMYISLRVLLFVLIIFLYSSTARFFSAFAIFALVLLFNTVRDFRRWRERTRQQQQQQPPAAPPVPGAAEGAVDPAMAGNNADRSIINVTPNQPAQGFWGGCVNFVSGLLASLVPDNNGV